MDGFGPETITIKKLENGIYKYYVHQYSNDGSLKESKGRVSKFLIVQIAMEKLLILKRKEKVAIGMCLKSMVKMVIS